MFLGPSTCASLAPLLTSTSTLSRSTMTTARSGTSSAMDVCSSVPLNLRFLFLLLKTLMFFTRTIIILLELGVRIWACIYMDFIFISEFTLTHVDEFIDELLTKDYSCDTALPRIQKRFVFSSVSQSHTLENYFACGILHWHTYHI